MSWFLNICCDTESPVESKRYEIKANKASELPEQTSPLLLTPHGLVLRRNSSGLDDLGRAPKKDRYEGEQLRGAPHGNGSMLYANGDFYRGEWVNGRKEGRGLQIYQ